MKTLVSVFVSFCMFHFASSHLDYFIMSEAHIGEFRAYEDDNSGYSPLYMTCTGDKFDLKACKPGTPVIFERDGINAIMASSSTKTFYGCPLDEDEDEIFSGSIVRREILMKRARRIHFTEYNGQGERTVVYLNVYKFNCKKELLPSMWATSTEQYRTKIEYEIGFRIAARGKMALASVLYDYEYYIPIRTKHTLHGASMASPIAAFNPIEHLEYGDDYNDGLPYAIQSYNRFNSDSYPIRKTYNAYLTERRLDNLRGKIVMAHLIPEYDMVQGSWKRIANFVHTIAPMWKDLYVGVWADIENSIRRAAFVRQSELTIYTGTHGKLTFNTRNPRPFMLHETIIPVPEMIWKLVIDDVYSGSPNKKAIVIILHNKSEQMRGANTFTKFQPPCKTRCLELSWLRYTHPNIFCCTVRETKNIITEFPKRAQTEIYDILDKYIW